MPELLTITGTPSPEEVRTALDDMVASEVFRYSPQLAAFLRFVVDAVLGGRTDRIKGYTIGVEALKRDAHFDPQIDPIVRVEATRLRRAMDRYYATAGAASPVRIELVRGTYAPRFSYRVASHGTSSDIDTMARATQLPPGNGMPTLSIEPLIPLTPAGAQSISVAALLDKLCDAFTRFDTINIALDAGNGGEIPINYQLVGSVEFRDDGTANVRCRLRDVGDHTVVWSRVFERISTIGGREAAEDAIVTELAATLVQPFGVIRARERARHLSSDAGDPRYRAIVEASESFRSFDPVQHAHARDALERLLQIDPGFDAGFSYLAALYFREYQYGYSGEKADPAILDRALDTGRKAIELKPESARAYQILFGVLFVRREIAAAFAAGDKAMALNRYDTTISSDYGGRLIMIGEVARGMEMLQRSGEFGTVRPSWHHFYLFLGSYLSGDLINTVHHASQITSNDYTLGLVARALAAKAANDTGRAERAITALVALNPNWGRDPRGELDRFFPVAAPADRLARDLAELGLPGRTAAVT